jgi:hypothetical protein
MANHVQMMLVVIAIGSQFRPLWAALSHHSRESPDQPSSRPGGDSTRGEDKSLSLSIGSKMSLLSQQADSALTTVGTAAAVKSSESASDGFVPDQVLSKIQSVECLEDKMKAISSNCATPGQTPKKDITPTDESYCSTRKGGELLTISTYPHFSDPCCNSGGEYFCDPDDLLAKEDQQSIQKDLNIFGGTHPVQCPTYYTENYRPGQSSVGSTKSSFHHNDNYDQRLDRTFWLGIALAKDLPPSESDPDSLQTMGLLLLDKWGLTQPLDVCAHSALLIIVPGERVAHIASASCEFICQERGGPEVVTAVLAALDTGGVVAAVKAGILETGRVVKKLNRLAKRRLAGPGGFDGRQGMQLGTEEEMVKSEKAWAFGQQAIFGLVIGSIFMTILASIVICCVPSLRMKAEEEIFGDPRFSLSRSKALTNKTIAERHKPV